jgi:hypothetical protein
LQRKIHSLSVVVESIRLLLAGTPPDVVRKDARSNDMQSQRKSNPIRIVWEHLPDPDSAKLVRQAVELILAEIEHDSTGEGFDKIAAPGHAEGVPVGNNDKSIFPKS